MEKFDIQKDIMKKYQKEISKLTAKEVLLSVFDLATPFFEAHSIYRAETRRYKENRMYERSNFLEKVRYLKKQGMIDTFVENKEKYIEITPKGLERINWIQVDELTIEKPQVWDSKWRIVIFDIPNKRKVQRDLFREKLIKLGFEKIQESVYVFPFECTKVISEIAESYVISDNVLIMVSEIIQGEGNIIMNFFRKNILSKKDIVSELGTDEQVV